MQTFTDPKHGTVVSTFTDEEAAYRVLQSLPNNDFAQSMASATFRALKKGYTASPAQRFWLHKLAVEIDQPKVERVAGKFPKVAGTMRAANAYYKRGARITFADIAGNGKLKLRVAGPNSKHAGCVMLDNGTSWGELGRKFFGRITPEGAYIPSGSDTAWVADFLATLDADFPGTVAEQGKLHGSCCFCGLTLTDDSKGKSLAVGYGPVCAQKFEMPWG